ncbi:PadR family transcriptional regulator [Nocardioides nematodiphilus]|uniref:PadR family transcriptional regulator n=1 Tax=Nocardioides nematodiphilus TaxID=2849669 RepID=UPI001CD94255|nr:PadR family transcriptional regulator [Nocardioides nematodiphilus]MCA1981826.1 PadR family transcriptional regulator [Nocardioides nematodiphilus]
MAIEHALLVSLRERPAGGLELARRFDRSIGFFWPATHQQIYKVLHRMAADGWIAPTGDEGARTTYAVTPRGEEELAAWIVRSTPTERLRSELALKMRAASYGDRATLLAEIEGRVAEHRIRLAHYETLQRRDYPEPTGLTGQDLDQYLVLRGGVLLEEFWIRWLTEYLEAHA